MLCVRKFSAESELTSPPPGLIRNLPSPVQRPKVAAIRVRMVIPGVVVVVAVVAVGCGGILDFHLEAWLLKTYEEILKILIYSHDFW